ncbi:orotidine-5'-phosphate decarboxylase [soil metagenome]
MTAFTERLTIALRNHGPLCVGLDPRFESLPSYFKHLTPAAAYEAFCLRVLELVRPYSGIVKPQAAFFEQAGPDGMKALQTVMHKARDLGFVTILDAKRGDIASTAQAYAEAAFSPAVWHADAVTVNPYLGADSVEPFISEARKYHGGLFILVRTSNPGGGLFQNLQCEGEPLYRHVAKAVHTWDAGHGDVGAVVGATHPRELLELRTLLPNAWFLVPGYGAQGGTAADIRPAIRGDGLGLVINSSRGVTFPFTPEDTAWESKIAAAAERAAKDLR